MVAERKNPSESQRKEYLTLVALYELEERANELLDRLSAMGIETDEATIVRVQPPQQPRPMGHPPEPGTLSPPVRSAVTGAIIGSSAALLIGVALYELGVLSLTFIEGLFLHAFVSTLAGAVAGAAIGALVAATRGRKRPAPAVPPVQSVTREGFLVVIKTPPHLAEQSEAVARRLGAKEILL